MATYIYSSLDQTARKINVAKFVNKKVMVMIVTDVAVSLREQCGVIYIVIMHLSLHAFCYTHTHTG